MHTAGVMLRLHFIPGGPGNHDFGHHGRNGVTVTQFRGTGLLWSLGQSFKVKELKYAVVERRERFKT